jgi:hypothetical protein
VMNNSTVIFFLLVSFLGYADVEQLETIQVTEERDFELPLSRIERESVVKKKK